ncbi:RICIN domain-containing protein [Streptomyces sp. NPDC050211]|uniref:RICIN domain-containing protein n=1 Tax=Streptomyces sp. NPDC050211 TaxID=3154932 RepID=UPI003440236B
MGDQTDRALQEVGDAAEFVALLRRLKKQSGLSYRQLEERAAERGEVLPRSTLADVLRHDALPRPEMLEAFLLACGEERNTEAWAQARQRIAATGVNPRTEKENSEGPGERPAYGRLGGSPLPEAEPLPAPVLQARDSQESWSVRAGGSWPSRLGFGLFGSPKRLLGTALISVVLVGGGYFMLAAVDDDKDDLASPMAGTYRIRSLMSSLCLSEHDGEERGYVSQVDCGSSLTYALEEKGNGVYRIRSLHPVFGYGCLGVDTGSRRRGARIQHDYCGHRGASEQFRLNRAGADGYRLVPLHTNACVSVPSGTKDVGAPLLQLPCGSGNTGQVFRLDPVPSPSAIPDITSNEY